MICMLPHPHKILIAPLHSAIPISSFSKTVLSCSAQDTVPVRQISGINNSQSNVATSLIYDRIIALLQLYCWGRQWKNLVNWLIFDEIMLKRMYSGPGTGGRCCIGAGQTLCEYSPGCSTFQCEMTSWPPSWNYDVVSETRSVNRNVFTWRTIVRNFVPITFETTEPGFLKRSLQQEEEQQQQKEQQQDW